MKQIRVFVWGKGGGCEKYARYLSARLNADISFLPLKHGLIEDTFAVFILPVYAQSLPASAAECLKQLKAQGCAAFPVVVCGGISFGDALYRLAKILKEADFSILGGGVFRAAHSYNTALKNKILPNHPTAEDLEQLLSAVQSKYDLPATDVDLNIFKHRRSVFSRLPQRLLAALSVRLPVVKGACTHCNSCVAVCPVGAIDGGLKVDKKRCVRCLKCALACKAKARRAEFSQPFIRLYLKTHRRAKENMVF